MADIEFLTRRDGSRRKILRFLKWVPVNFVQFISESQVFKTIHSKTQKKVKTILHFTLQRLIHRQTSLYR